jgi:hypothetical protein
VLELKTELVDLNELLGTLDRKRRLATAVADGRGWSPATVSIWVIVADSRTNRRAISAHAVSIRSKLPTDGRGIKRWMDRPGAPMAALSFLPSVQGTHLAADTAHVKRVVRPGSRSSRRPQGTG